MRELKLEIRDQDDQTPHVGPAMLTPPISDDYWAYRVRVADGQAIVAFPKFGVIGIGFAVEEDWNTNLPSDSSAETIYDHIEHNRGDESITRETCIEAIRMIQDAITADQAPKLSDAEQAVANVMRAEIANEGVITTADPESFNRTARAIVAQLGRDLMEEGIEYALHRLVGEKHAVFVLNQVRAEGVEDAARKVFGTTLTAHGAIRQDLYDYAKKVRATPLPGSPLALAADSAAEAEAELSAYLQTPSQVLDLIKVEETIDMEDHNHDR
jgi:hypothetical protein